MKYKDIRAVLTLGFLVLAASTEGGQHRWTRPAPSTISPKAAIDGSSNGLYCPDMTDRAVGLHDLGWIPVGLNVTVTVVSNGPSTFDPVAAVLVAGVGAMSGGTVKTTAFYDNDSGGDKDPKISFVTPQDGTYFLIVGENSGNGGGCYRYQVSVR